MQSSNGTPISFFYEWKGLAGSEDTLDPDTAKQVLSDVDRYLEHRRKLNPILRISRKNPVTVFVKGYWDGFQIIDSDDELPEQKEGLPPVWDVDAALATWQNAEFKLATTSGIPILFHHEYEGMVGSEARHSEHHEAIVAGCDHAISAYPDLEYVVVDVKGNWDELGVVRPGAKLPPPKEGMPEESAVSLFGVLLAAQVLRAALSENDHGGDGINGLIAALTAADEEDCSACTAENCPIRREAYVS